MKRGPFADWTDYIGFAEECEEYQTPTVPDFNEVPLASEELADIDFTLVFENNPKHSLLIGI